MVWSVLGSINLSSIPTYSGCCFIYWFSFYLVIIIPQRATTISACMFFLSLFLWSVIVCVLVGSMGYTMAARCVVSLHIPVMAESLSDLRRLKGHTILAWNIRSLLPKIEEVDRISLVGNPELICICETWLNENIDNPQIDNMMMASPLGRAQQSLVLE